jgi:hypothetical protein
MFVSLIGRDSLSTSPEVTARLREEIMTFVGPSDRPTYDNIKQMKYLRAVINGMVPKLYLERFLILFKKPCAYSLPCRHRILLEYLFILTLFYLQSPFNIRYARSPNLLSLHSPYVPRQSIKATTWPSPDPKEKPLYIPAGVSFVFFFFFLDPF